MNQKNFKQGGQGRHSGTGFQPNNINNMHTLMKGNQGGMFDYTDYGFGINKEPIKISIDVKNAEHYVVYDDLDYEK